MSNNFVRVVNNQVLERSILIDKIDRSQGNFTNYAQVAKQKIYVPYVNPDDTTVKGYIDLVPTDEVRLSAANGTISGLASATPVPYVLVSSVDPASIVAPVVTGASNSAGSTTIDGTTFLSVSPDVTRVTFTDLSGASQTVSTLAGNTGTSITVSDSAVVGGPPTTGWKVTVFANSKLSNQFTL